jgi:hypothetical protein
MNKLIRIDERSEEEIARVIDFSQSSDFWKANILSVSKLREKFATLLLQSESRRDDERTNKSQSSTGEPKKHDLHAGLGGDRAIIHRPTVPMP